MEVRLSMTPFERDVLDDLAEFKRILQGHTKEIESLGEYVVDFEGHMNDIRERQTAAGRRMAENEQKAFEQLREFFRRAKLIKSKPLSALIKEMGL